MLVKIMYVPDNYTINKQAKIIRNNTNGKITVNNKVALYAAIVEITENTPGESYTIKCKTFAGTDVTVDYAFDNELIYNDILGTLCPFVVSDDAIYAFMVLCNELIYKLTHDEDAEDVETLQSLRDRITELENGGQGQANPDILSLYDINLAELSITKLAGGVSGSTISGGEIQVELYPGKDDVLLPNLNQVISVLDVKVNEESVTLNQSGISNHTQKTSIHIGVSFRDVEYNDSPIPISVTIKNNQTNKQYTITDSLSVVDGQIVLNGGGGSSN